ncbi:DUF4407 domain-containing protein [Nostoc sp. ChiQUE01b]|uniref:DUF4407 domain-containing protein n=1 Tax=Nostoc sp. ChiQUE01b TaxID=3075376 RepID=UPI002AD4A8B2|nr:DUF4407 domain-containing protein [Nostoc sp. ChiQUE01b]MDZ8258163.1 DUF4407 domain-containing protein [Nostoc sp. ChiQUE01b]
MPFPSLKRFLLFASGINTNIVSHESMSPENRFSEENKYASIGASIVLTATVAFLSGSYALYTVFNSAIVSSLIGFIWGIKIFNLDRFIILSSRKKKDNFLADIIVIIPRLLLAFSLGFVIAKPVEIKIFENKITQKFKETNAQQSAEILKIQMSKLEKINKEEVNRTAFLKREYDSSDLVKKSNENYDNLRKKLQEETQKRLEEFNYKGEIGLIAKIQILESLKKDDPTIEYSSLFVTILFVAIDSVPIILKLLSKYGPYDAYIETQEEDAIYLKSKELSDIEKKNNEIKNIKKIDRLSDRILSITVKIPNDKELTQLAKYKLDDLKQTNLSSPNLQDIRNEILQKNLQINQNKVLITIQQTNELQSNNEVKTPSMANINENGQQKNINN